MQIQSRIPKLNEVSFDGALMWFSEMQCQKLLFHPEDDPAEIIRIADGKPTFSKQEVKEIRFLMEKLEKGIGHEQVVEAAYPIFLNACGIQLDA
jgi:hypothetical protein